MTQENMAVSTATEKKRLPQNNSPSASQLATLLHLEQRALAATNIDELGFVIVNETYNLSVFRQALLLKRTLSGQFKLDQASGLASIVEDSPFSIWLQSFIRSLNLDPKMTAPIQLTSATIDEHLRSGWSEWLPEYILIVPVIDVSEQLQSLVIYAREKNWNSLELQLLHRLHTGYSYCMRALGESKHGIRQKLLLFFRSGNGRWLCLAALMIFLIPVRLSVLAPAEVVALNAIAVASPIDGVVGEFYIQPNTAVSKGDALFSLDDSALRGRRDVASKALLIARSDALVAEQRAFDDFNSKAELASALGRVREKEAELGAVDVLLERVTVKAERDGLALFSDKNDWIGRPVQTGERIMQVASAADAGIAIWLPVADAINLELGAPIRLFLHTQPLTPWAAELLQTSYQASQSPEGVSAYKLLGEFDSNQMKPRLGLRGTARISSEWTLLGYYIFRRPFAALREWSGL